jgi:hypothetical protein
MRQPTRYQIDAYTRRRKQKTKGGGERGAHRMSSRAHWQNSEFVKDPAISKKEEKRLLRTRCARVRLEHALVLLRVRNSRRVKRDGAFCVRDDRRPAARRECRVQRGRFATEVGHATRDLPCEFVTPHQRPHIGHPARWVVGQYVRNGRGHSADDSRWPGTKSSGAETSSPWVMCTWPRATRGVPRRWGRTHVSMRQDDTDLDGCSRSLTVKAPSVKYLRGGTRVTSPRNLDTS